MASLTRATRSLGRQCIEEKLQGRQALLAVDDSPLLHQARLVGHLLEHNGAKKVRLVPVLRLGKYTFGDATDVFPKRLPLGLL
jgi:hypothetical protein